MRTELDLACREDDVSDDVIDEREYHQFNDIGLALRLAALRACALDPQRLSASGDGRP